MFKKINTYLKKCANKALKNVFENETLGGYTQANSSKINVEEYKAIRDRLKKNSFEILSVCYHNNGNVKLFKLWLRGGGSTMELTLQECETLLGYLESTPFKKTIVEMQKTEVIERMALNNGYLKIVDQKFPPMLSFKKGVVRINVFYSTMTVATCIPHPTKGKTQLFRKNVSMTELDNIFKEPRVHTGKGYYKN